LFYENKNKNNSTFYNYPKFYILCVKKQFCKKSNSVEKK
jgi:hypothetical protein